MEAKMGKDKTVNCFKLNEQFVLQKSDKKIQVLSVKDILKKNNFLELSEYYQKKLEKQSSCLASFLFRIYGFDEEYLIVKDEHLIRDYDVISKHFKLPNENLILIWRMNLSNYLFSMDLERNKELIKCDNILKIE
uniref:FERM domain-containing protein n=1 Tax=Meloidogyne hapla TaxID=6305 RepID=A0A1I8BEU8_MELHA